MRIDHLMLIIKVNLKSESLYEREGSLIKSNIFHANFNGLL